MKQNLDAVLLSLACCILVLSIGCEVTDYEPLMAKQQAKQDAGNNSQLAIGGGQINSLMPGNGANKGTAAGTGKQQIAVPPRPAIDQIALATKLSNKGVYVGVDDSEQRIVELEEKLEILRVRKLLKFFLYLVLDIQNRDI